MFSGSHVALVTPFRNGKVDIEKLKSLVEFHIENGTDGIVPCGTSGESATLSNDEHRLVIETVVKTARKRIKVIAGTGSNNTTEALEMTEFAKEAGSDGALLIAPYYNRPTQEGLYLHFRKIAQEIDIPLIVYNIPSRTGINILPETMVRLAKIKNIAGVKESSGSMDQISQIIMECPKEFCVLSGDDSMTLPVMAVGGKGVISVAANIVPKDVKGLVTAFSAGNVEKAKKTHMKLFPLIKALFCETNPIPVKTAMGIMGMISGELRLPLCPLSDENLSKLKKELKDYGLMK